MERASFDPTTARKAKRVAVAGFEKHRKSAVQANLKFYIVGAVVAIAAVVIVVTAMQGSSVYYYTIAEFQTQQATLKSNDSLRVSGMVLPGSIKKDDISHSVTFTAIDKTDKTKTLTVTYSGVIPDTFKDEAEVVVTGSYGQGVFQAKEMLAKCPSKYSSQA
jgi:cytochrome c-type biogenesis protein CcmE